MSDQILNIHDWMGLLHPVLIILFVYPVMGATIRLGILAREKRLAINPIAATVPKEHAQHGAWVTGSVLVAVLLGLSHSLITEAKMIGAIIVVSTIVLIGYGRLLQTREAWQRGGWALVCLSGLLVLGLHPSVDRLGDLPWSPLFWQSHFWMGWLLSALLLGNTALQPLIGSNSQARKLHIAVNLVVALLLAMQAISGTRNLLLTGFHIAFR